MLMKQAFLQKPKELLINELNIPDISDNELLVKNIVSTTCGTDYKNYQRGYPLLNDGQPFGHEFSGIVVDVGKNVQNFEIGDRIVAHNTAPCNKCYFCKQAQHSLCDKLIFNRGTYANYVKLPREIIEQNTFILPDTMSHKTACLLEPFSCAVYGRSQITIEPGDTVIVNGCGPIGLMFIILAKYSGAKVISTDLSEYKLKKAREVGSDVAINMTNKNSDSIRKYTPNNRGGDVVIEATGVISVWESSLEMVRKGGEVLLFGGTKKDSILTADANLLHYSQITIKGVFHTTPKYVEKAFDLLKMNILDETIFIQNEYPIEDLEKAIIEHGNGSVIKNCIVYERIIE